MPAAAVIPAPLAYIKIVAVKKLVVGHLVLNPPGPERFEVLSFRLELVSGRSDAGSTISSRIHSFITCC